MLNAIVDVPEMGIKDGRVIAVTERIGGYKLYRVSFNPKPDEINPSSLAVHEDEITMVDDSDVKELGEAKLELGDKVKLSDPLNIEGVLTGIVHSSSGCLEYEVYYQTERGIVTNILPEPLLNKIGTSAEPGTQTGSMNRSVERRM